MNYKKIKQIIDKWDPVDLLSHTPSDEYDIEIQKISELITKESSVYEIADNIHCVFLESFGVNVFDKSLNECIDIAIKIFK